MNRIEGLKRAFSNKDEIYIENEVRFSLIQQDYSNEDLEIIYKLINYVRWNSPYDYRVKIKYVSKLCLIFIENYSSRDWRYSDVFTTYIDFIFYSQNDSSKDYLNVAHKALSLCNLQDYKSYHFLLYLGLQKYFLGEKNHIFYLSQAAEIFRKYAKEKKYSNHNLRGLQFMVCEDDIKYYSDTEKLFLNYQLMVGNLSQQKEKIHLIALDTKYFERFSEYIILGSRQEFLSLHIHLINPTQSQIELLDKESINYSYEYENYLDNKPYLISSRFLILNELMNYYKEAKVFIITDADCLLQHDKLDLVINRFMDADSKDLAIQSNQSFYPWSKHGAGIIMVKKNYKMIEFFDLFNKVFNQLYDRERTSVMNTQWWIDQGIIYSLINSLEIDIFDLEKVADYIYFPKGDKDVELKNIFQSFEAKFNLT